MSTVGRSWCLLVWAGSAVPAATSYTCSAAGTIQAPLTSATETLDKLKADLSLVPDCHVHKKGVAIPVDCNVSAGSVVKFWFTCDPVDKSTYGCQNTTWFEKYAIVRVKDLTASATSSFGSPLIPTPKEWDTNWYPHWQTSLTKGFQVKRTTGFNFADVEITWKVGHRPAPGDRIHLHTSIDHMSPDVKNCTGDVGGSGNGASSLQVGTTTTKTTTQTTTSTTCRWALKPCGQCLATPVEYCPLDPATEKAMLGPVSGMSYDTPILDTSRLERRLSKKGCVAAASLYPEIGVCASDDPICAHPSHQGVVDTGTNISILLKITNHCINKANADKEAWLVGEAVRDLVDRTVMFGEKYTSGEKYISADLAELGSPRLVEKFFREEDLQNNGSLRLNSRETDKRLVRYVATVRLTDEKTHAVEISARLRDRSIQIMEEINEIGPDDCAKEEGTAWGSTAITVRTTTLTTTTRTTTSRTTTSRTTTSSTETHTETTSTSSTSTLTTSTTTTVTTTTRPCACFEMCCEPEPVQGVHLPVVENVCPEWWQGKMTGRASVNTSGLNSDLDQSLQMKGSASTARATADPPSERVVFRKWSGEEDIFRKWSSARINSESSSRRSWVAIGVLLVGSAAVLQAVLTLRWRRASAQPEMPTGDAGVMDRLVQREETNDWVW